MQFRHITSKKNETLSFIRSLQEKKYRRQHGLFFLEGVTLFEEALSAGLVPHTVVLSSAAPDGLYESVKTRFEEGDTVCLSVEHDVYRTLSAELAPQGVLAVFETRLVTENSKKIHNSVTKPLERYIILENIQDPGNVGTMLRSAAAFGYTGALLVATADLFSPKTVRACMGALFHLDIHLMDRFSDALDFVRERGLKLYTTSPHVKKAVREADFTTPFAVLIGNEGAGASEEALAACDEQLTIPMQGMESLNAAAACAIVLYESVRDH